MEAAAASQPAAARELPRDKATRIAEAMRVSVAARGFSASTFDQVARQAGVSRGLLHYYFGTKEQLLIEAVRRESDVRLHRLDEAVAPAESPDQVMAALVASLEDFLGEAPNRAVMFFEVLTLAQRNEEIAAELAELGRRIRAHLAEVLAEKDRAGVLSLRADPEDTATLLFVLADGITVRRLCEPELEIAPLMAQAVRAAQALLT